MSDKGQTWVETAVGLASASSPLSFSSAKQSLKSQFLQNYQIA